MTNLTGLELKVIYAQLFMGGAIAVFWALFLMQPISMNAITPETSANTQTNVSISGSSWITSILHIPSEFVVLVEITALFITPLLIFDAYIVIRAIKDLATQWV